MKFILPCLIIALTFQCYRCETRDAEQKTDSENVNSEHVENKPGAKVNEELGNENSENVASKPNVPSITSPENNNNTNNATKEMKGDEGLYEKLKANKDMLMRTFYVLLGVTSIVIIYFVIRAWRSKRRYSKSRKYGLITSSGADLEMEPLDQDVDDDDEMTMFERHK